MLSLLILLVAALVVATLVPRVLRAFGPDADGRALAAEAAARREAEARLARMEEAIQVMATEIERLRTLQSPGGGYLSADAESPRRSTHSEDDSTPA